MMKIAFTGHRASQRPLPEEMVRGIARGAYGAEEDGNIWLHGGAQGFDSLVDQIAQEFGIPTMVYKPDWDKHGKSAGMIRNKQMVDEADIVVAFWDGRKTGGTYGTVQYADKQGKLWALLGLPKQGNIAIGG